MRFGRPVHLTRNGNINEEHRNHPDDKLSNMTIKDFMDSKSSLFYKGFHFITTARGLNVIELHCHSNTVVKKSLTIEIDGSFSISIHGKLLRTSHEIFTFLPKKSRVYFQSF